MGLFDRIKEKKEKVEAESDGEPQGKYREACALCGAGETDSKWMGQYWHKKCKRVARKQAKGMM